MFYAAVDAPGHWLALLLFSTAAEDIGFPFAAQVALIGRQHVGRKAERVGLITDLPPEQLPVERWLNINRLAWDIESGTHQRLDVSLNEDRRRVQKNQGIGNPGQAPPFGPQSFHALARPPFQTLAPILDGFSSRHGR
jgi:hypothetical protein